VGCTDGGAAPAAGAAIGGLRERRERRGIPARGDAKCAGPDGVRERGLVPGGGRRVGRLVLDRVVDNFFAETEQVAFDSGNLVPGIDVSDDPLLRFQGYGWAAERIDGHDHAAIAEAIRRAQSSDRPNLIACRTTIAFGAPTKAGTAAAHGSPLGATASG